MVVEKIFKKCKYWKYDSVNVISMVIYYFFLPTTSLLDFLSVVDASPPAIIWKVTESLKADYTVNVHWDGLHRCLAVVFFYMDLLKTIKFTWHVRLFRIWLAVRSFNEVWDHLSIGKPYFNLAWRLSTLLKCPWTGEWGSVVDTDLTLVLIFLWEEVEINYNIFFCR